MQRVPVYFILSSLLLTTAWAQETPDQEMNSEVKEEFLHPHEKIDTEARESFFEQREEQQQEEFYPVRDPEREIQSPAAPPIEE
jgi:hypothetical protein